MAINKTLLRFAVISFLFAIIVILFTTTDITALSLYKYCGNVSNDLGFFAKKNNGVLLL